MDVMTRIDVSPEEWKALKVLAIESELSIKELLTSALKSSPLTSPAFPTSQEVDA